jgi:competence protein ComEC
VGAAESVTEAAATGFGGERERPGLGAPAAGRALLEALNGEQDRWFLWIPVLLGVGVWGYFQLPAEPGLLVATMPALVACALAFSWRRGLAAVLLTNSLLAVTMGFGLAKLRAAWVDAPVLQGPLARAEVMGFVEAVESGLRRGQRATLRVVKLGSLDPEKRPKRVRIRMMAREPVLKPGDPVKLKATLAPPARPASPGDYDFARAAWFQGVGAVGYAVTPPAVDRSIGEPPLVLGIAAAIERLRQAIGERVRQALPGEEGAIATALITGERGGISAETNDAFRDSGLFHILSISGLHMTVMAGAVFFAVRLALAAIPAIALRFPIKKWAAATAVAGAFGYLLISGSAIATVRSWIMISIMFAAVMLDRPALALRNVALAALVILAVAPESLYDAGFQMSFAAVVALLSGYELLRDRMAARPRGAALGPALKVLLFFGGIILSTVIASLAVAPFAAYHFHKSQQYAVLANLIAIPICNAVVMPASLATLVLMPLGLETAPLWIMGKGIEGMVWCAYAVAGLPGAVGRIPAFSDLAFALMIGGGLWVCLWRRRWRLAGLAGVAAGLALTPFSERPDLLVGRDGHLVAARGADGRLWALPAAGAAFELQRWLERDGDGRTAREATSEDKFRCDGVGCLVSLKGKLVAVSRHPAALADDCRRADLLILAFPVPRGCERTSPTIDFFAARQGGTHTVRIDGGEYKISSVAASRGDRPWSRRSASVLAEVPRRPSAYSRLPAFAPPAGLNGSSARPRPEVEEDDAPEVGDSLEP